MIFTHTNNLICSIPTPFKRYVFSITFSTVLWAKMSEKLGDITRWHKIQPKCIDIIRRELWCYICMVLLVAWDSEHDTTTPRYRLIFTCQHTHPYYSCLIPLSPISNELLWKQKQINKKTNGMYSLIIMRQLHIFFN